MVARFVFGLSTLLAFEAIPLPLFFEYRVDVEIGVYVAPRAVAGARRARVFN